MSELECILWVVSVTMCIQCVSNAGGVFATFTTPKGSACTLAGTKFSCFFLVFKVENEKTRHESCLEWKATPNRHEKRLKDEKSCLGYLTKKPSHKIPYVRNSATPNLFVFDAYGVREFHPQKKVK